MATKTARKPTAAKSARKTKSKSASSAKAAGSSKSKSKMLSGKGLKASASKTRATAKAKKAIAPKKSASSKSATASRSTTARSKMNEPTNDARMSADSENSGLTAQAKMKLSRRNPKNFRDEQRLQSTPDSVNPATRR